jgi:hypothetical protein
MAMAAAGGEGGRRGRGRVSSELHGPGAPVRPYCTAAARWALGGDGASGGGR